MPLSISSKPTVRRFDPFSFRSFKTDLPINSSSIKGLAAKAIPPS